MTFDVVEKKNCPLYLKIFKTAYRSVIPFLTPVAVMAFLLSFFTPIEGQGARISAIVVLIVCVAVIVGCFVLNAYLMKRDDYRLYQNKFMAKVHVMALLWLFISVAIILIPFYTFVITSIKIPKEANSMLFTWIPKQGVSFNAYGNLFIMEDAIGTSMLSALGNTLLFAIIPTTVGIFVSSLSAYGFSKLYFPGRNVLFNLFLFTMMLPSCITMTSSYVMFDRFGWTGSPLPIIIPGCFGGVGTVLFLKEYFTGISNEILEAAKVDGAGKLRIFFSCMLPMSMPALIAQFVLGFISACNNFTGALVYLTEPELYTLPMFLNILSGSVRDKNMMAAASIITIIPMLVLYVVFQKQILSGISMSDGIKG